MFTLKKAEKKQKPDTEPPKQPEMPKEQKPEVSETLLKSSSPDTATPTHFDSLLNGADMPVQDTAAPMSPAQEQGGTGKIQREDFHKLFLTGFNVAHNLTGYKSLKVSPEDSAAQDCSTAIYDTILDIPALHFLLNPSNKWMDRAVAIGAFTIPMAIAVKTEAAQKKKPVKQKPASFTTAKKATQEKSQQTGDPTPEQIAALTGA